MIKIKMEVEGFESHDRCFIDCIKREIDSGISFESVLQTVINMTNEKNENPETAVSDDIVMKACLLMMCAYALSRCDDEEGYDDFLEFKMIAR